MTLLVLLTFLFTNIPLGAAQASRQSSTSQSKQRLTTLRKHEQTCFFNKSKNIRHENLRGRSRKQTEKTSTKKIHPISNWISYSHTDYTIRIPTSWQCIDDKVQLPEKLDVVFIGQGTGSLTPTINIAQEVTSKQLSEYIEEILAYHKANELTLESSVFTQIQSPSGEFTIIKTEKKSSWGRVFCLQAVTIVNHNAYIVTSTATLDDYPTLSFTFLKTVASFQLTSKESSSGNVILQEALNALENEIKDNH
ncbi:hypothetical protein [Candidatus Chlamydia sanziniae]|uniref:Uncharacterized protein n=1 Tax=Candidatus Chlamydia sanziniae TaxID=1806891 RepID=A0A1A9HV50_9CHLA|nr:hypothetical protein [Candidatus Chlamydia sanziniae]ANH78868.1 hypothetical protein Cs308_0698 [Candidatus Chlamydia sanziniae]